MKKFKLVLELTETPPTRFQGGLTSESIKSIMDQALFCGRQIMIMIIVWRECDHVIAN